MGLATSGSRSPAQRKSCRTFSSSFFRSGRVAQRSETMIALVKGSSSGVFPTTIVLRARIESTRLFLPRTAPP